MTRISFTWSTEQITSGPFAGRFIVIERTSSGDERRWGPIPGPVIEAFIRHRRSVVYGRARDAGAVRIFNAPEERVPSILDWPPTKSRH